MQDHRPHRGFTIIEMIIVIGIIAVLASISVPPLVKARKLGAESAAKQVLRSLRAAEVHYKSKHGVYASLDRLYAFRASGVREGGVDPATGYMLTSTATDDSFTIVAHPPKTDMRSYTLIETGALLGEE